MFFLHTVWFQNLTYFDLKDCKNYSVLAKGIWIWSCLRWFPRMLWVMRTFQLMKLVIHTHTADTSLLWCKGCSSKQLDHGGAMQSIRILYDVVWRWADQGLCFNSCSKSIGSILLEAGLVIYTYGSILCGKVNLRCVVFKREFYSHDLRFLLRVWQTWVFRPQWNQVFSFRVRSLLPHYP